MFFRILVKMDDNIIRHYSNESTFMISFDMWEDATAGKKYDISLAEIDPKGD